MKTVRLQPVGRRENIPPPHNSLTLSVSERYLSASWESLCVFHRSVKSMVWSLCRETYSECGIACFKDCGGQSSQTKHHRELVGFIWSQSRPIYFKPVRKTNHLDIRTKFCISLSNFCKIYKFLSVLSVVNKCYLIHILSLVFIIGLKWLRI